VLPIEVRKPFHGSRESVESVRFAGNEVAQCDLQVTHPLIARAVLALELVEQGVTVVGSLPQPGE
jgi:hypothetical protein